MQSHRVRRHFYVTFEKNNAPTLLSLKSKNSSSTIAKARQNTEPTSEMLTEVVVFSRVDRMVNRKVWAFAIVLCVAAAIALATVVSGQCVLLRSSLISCPLD